MISLFGSILKISTIFGDKHETVVNIGALSQINNLFVNNGGGTINNYNMPQNLQPIFDLEKAFIHLFDDGNLFDDALMYVCSRYGLRKCKIRFWRAFKMRLDIVGGFRKFPWTDDFFDALVNKEIRYNLSLCRTVDEKEALVLDILRGLRKFSDRFSLKTKAAQTNRLITELEADRKQWEASRDADAAGQIAACDRQIGKRKKELEQAEEKIGKLYDVLFRSVPNAKFLDDTTVEYCLHHMIIAVRKFAARLDDLLLGQGLNLMQIQEDCNIYIMENRK